MNYTLFVDESGQSGIKKIRTSTDGGASPYMTLGAALVRNDFRDTLELSLKSLREDFAKPDLHCSRLNHNQLVRTAKTLSAQEFKAFGVVSLKATLGSYKDRIGGSHSLYYNKCAQYLLEKVGQFMDENSITSEQLSVVFEEGSFDYAALRKLISACRQNPIHPDSKFLRNIEPFSISKKPKCDERLLELGDFVAHALYKCVDRNSANHGVTETRYLRELRSRFYSNPADRKIVGFGIKPVHQLSRLELEPEVQDFFLKLTSD